MKPSILAPVVLSTLCVAIPLPSLLQIRQSSSSGLSSLLGGFGSGSGTSGSSTSGLSSLLGGLGSSTGSTSGLGSLSGLLGSSSGSSSSSGLSSLLGGLGSGTSGSSTSGLGSLLGGLGTGSGSSGSGSSAGFDLGSLLGGLTGSGGSDTSNDFTSGGACKPFTLVFARGTSESGNMGVTVGPALQSGLTKKMAGKWAFQGLTYDASIANDFTLGTAGVLGTSSEADEAGSKLIDDIAAKCPDTKIIFSGYSQGAMVAHLSVQNAKSKGKVAGVLTYGDPFSTTAIKGYPASQVKIFCADGDSVCSGLFVISAAHLSYVGEDTDAGIAWIQQILGA